MRVTFLSASLSLLIALTGSVQAQTGKDDKIKTAEFQPGKKDDKKKTQGDPLFKPAKITELRHGNLVHFSDGASKTSIQGTFVRVDSKAKQLYVRVESGSPAQPIAVADIKDLEREVSLLPVGSDTEVRDIVRPEIQVIEFYNGKKRTVTYAGPTLSSGERSMLVSLQDAENELADLEFLTDRQTQVLDNAIAIQLEQKKGLELLNRYQDLMNNYLADRFSRLGGLAPFFGQSSYLLMDAYGTYGAYGQYGLYGSQPVAPPAIIQVGPIVTPTVVLPSASLTKARQNLMVAQENAVFEQNRLVAVVFVPK